MSQETLVGEAFTWNHIQRLYDADPAIHWQRCESEGLECAHEAFLQLFHENAHDADFAAIVRAIDWGRVRWELEEFSGVALRHVRVDRGYQYALDEARDRAAQFGIRDDRTEVLDHWRDAQSWLSPHVANAGGVAMEHAVVPLSSPGVRPATRVADLFGEKTSRLLVSKYRRARESAETLRRTRGHTNFHRFHDCCGFVYLSERFIK